MTACEAFVTEKVMDGRAILGLYPPSEATSSTEFAAWGEARGR